MAYNVKTILGKYWAGESTVAEEEILKAYFKQKEIDPELEQYRSLFRFFDAQSVIAMKNEVQATDTEIQEVATAKERKLVSYTGLRRMAAAVALLVGFFLFYQNNNLSTKEEIVWEDSYENPEEAYRKAKEVLSLVSRKMKKGTDKAAYSVGKAQAATSVIK